uniref:Uncharacterized protein n=1 Tax=Utricularia reniformis TaxID=192314 RepID=A0A1Y0AYT8_9LAMI|nr:hypothetical protein AEK19_MT0893 [Utricularia reniformis]ART30326.1 hypothetical protein AEK19_MT0893 [Utricularia reniformis]
MSSAPKAHYAPLQQMIVFGGTGEPRELVRCVGQRARSTCASRYAVEGKEPKSTLFFILDSKIKAVKGASTRHLNEPTEGT